MTIGGGEALQIGILSPAADGKRIRTIKKVVLLGCGPHLGPLVIAHICMYGPHGKKRTRIATALFFLFFGLLSSHPGKPKWTTCGLTDVLSEAITAGIVSRKRLLKMYRPKRNEGESPHKARVRVRGSGRGGFARFGIRASNQATTLSTNVVRGEM